MMRIIQVLILALLPQCAIASWFEHCIFYGTYTDAREGRNEIINWKEYWLTLKVEEASTLIGSYVPCDRHIGKEFKVVLKPQETETWPNIGSSIIVEYMYGEGEQGNGEIGRDTDYKLIDLGGWPMPANKARKGTQ